MTIERGILINGTVLPDTDRVIRDPAAWWQPGERGTHPRQGHRIDRLVGHWTGGHPRTGPLAGPKVVATMKARKRDDGSPMDVGIHFVVSWDGLIWQTCDLGACTTHVGHRQINRRSVGVETCWPGTVTQATRLGVEVESVATGRARGVPVKCLPPSAELLDAWRWLYDALTRAQHPALTLPRQRGSVDRPGVLEHCDVPGTTKVDAGGLLLAALGLA